MLPKNTILALTSMALATVQAAPAAAAAVEAVGGSITTDCTNVRLQSGWLVGDCLTGQNTTRIQSTAYLVSKIANREGNLQWQTSGRYAGSCKDCQLTDGAKLNCLCRPSGGAAKNTTLDLQEHIRNYNGHLLSDLAGAPVIPKTNSAVKIPTNLRWDFYLGGKGCTTEDEVYNKQFCTPPKNLDLSCPSGPQTYSPDGSPSACTGMRVPIGGTPVWETFRSWSAKGAEKAWEFLVYEDLECKGAELAKITPEMYGQCANSEKAGKAIVVRPLWNADTT